MDLDSFIQENADPVWLHQYEIWAPANVATTHFFYLLFLLVVFARALSKTLEVLLNLIGKTIQKAAEAKCEEVVKKEASLFNKNQRGTSRPLSEMPCV